MKRLFTIVIMSMTTLVLAAQNLYQAYLDYIERYASTAVDEQRKYGIPASITLAQGILESQAGQSPLVQATNNHFGIKCHKDWTGPTYSHDDDAVGECFRVYERAEQSFEDHSKFLVERPRYADLFELNPTDYRAWANGLRADGYATDPNYGPKLIKLIEDYDLHRFDLMGVDAAAAEGSETASVAALPAAGSTARSAKTTKSGSSTPVRRTSANVVRNSGTSAPSASEGSAGRDAHAVFRVNGVRCIVAAGGDTYATIADEMGYKVDNLLRFNDMTKDRSLHPGEAVYLGSKRHAAHRGAPKVVIVREGDTAYTIAQEYGITVQSLYDMNNMDYASGVQFGQRIILRTK